MQAEIGGLRSKCAPVRIAANHRMVARKPTTTYKAMSASEIHAMRRAVRLRLDLACCVASTVTSFDVRPPET
jgi:hypothetical protein